MLEINTTIDIDAPPDRVWSQLIAFSAYPSWNPFIKALEGATRQGFELMNRALKDRVEQGLT